MKDAGSDKTSESSEEPSGHAALPAGRRANVLQSIDRMVLAVNRTLMIAALAAMSVIVFANVMLRYLTNDSIVWSEEVARYLMIWLTFLGIGPVLRLGGHIAVDTLQKAVPTPIARGLRLLIVGLIAAFCCTLAWFGLSFVERSWTQSTPVTEIPFSFIAVAVPTGFVLTLWHLGAVAVGYVMSSSFEVSPDLHPEEAGSV